MSSKTVYYFAYGSNMSSEVFTGRRKIHPSLSISGTVTNYQLVFDQRGIPFIEPRFASIKAEKGAMLHGVIHEITEDERDILHATEGSNYKMLSLEATSKDGHLFRCFTYIGHTSQGEGKPSQRYMHKILSGAREHKLPSHHIKYLESLETVHIPFISKLMDLGIKYLTIYLTKGKSLHFRFIKTGIKKDD
jgi:cation transport regulator ChaC